MYWKSSLWVPVWLCWFWNADMRIRCLPAASRGRDLTQLCIPVHYKCYHSLHECWLVVQEEEGLRRVSERHMLIGELRCSLNVVINSQSVETRNDMSQLEVVNNTLNSTSWYILYTHNLTWSLFALECSIAADANWFDWFSHRGFPPVNSRLRLKYGATIQRGGDWRFIGNEPHYKLKGEDWYKRRQLEIAIITQVNPYFTSAFSSSGGALKWIWGEIWSILSTTTL